VTVELLKSAGIEARHVQHFAQRTRPKVKSWRTVELYADAVVEPDDGKKKQLLVAALGEDPAFVYASRDLDALEERLRQYDAAARREQERALHDLHQSVQTEKDPAVLYAKYSQLLGSLFAQRRWRALLVLARAIGANPPPPAPPPYPSLTELAAFYLVEAEQALHEDDALLGDGEKFIAQHAASSYFTSVRTAVDQAIDRKHDAADGANRAAEEIAHLDAKERADACKVASIYASHHQGRDARRLYERCLEAGSSVFPKKMVYVNLTMLNAGLGDFTSARRWLHELEVTDPETWRSMKNVQLSWPSEP
jgi:hypothetical protein